jgi:phosphonate transport system permease protein
MKPMARRTVHRVFGWGVLAAGAAAAAHLGLLSGESWGRSWANGADFIGRMFPPDPSSLGTLVGSLFQTIEIAFAGTLIGFVVSVPLGCLADRSLFGPAVAVPARVLIGAVRSVPSIIYGLIAVVVVGLGAKAGVIAVAAYTVGYLAKFYYETFEAADPEVVEALRGVGAGRLQVFWHGVLPETANQVLSQLIFMFEYNVRASTIMGFVGAGGIGYYMMGYAQMLQYRSLMTALLLTFAVVVVVDAVSFRVRKSFSYAVGRKS